MKMPKYVVMAALCIISAMVTKMILTLSRDCNKLL